MFTGIIQEVGKLVRATSKGRGKELAFSCSKILPEIHLGDSVCCNGVCLSATHILDTGFNAFAVGETLSKTNLGKLQAGHEVNMELALLPTTRLSGHYVTGHIDGLAVVSSIQKFSDGSIEMTLTMPDSFSRYCIPKGSVALNGISLTIAKLQGRQLTVAVIPVTIAHTTLNKVTVGSSLNLELDIMGKYAEKLLGPYKPDGGSLSLQKLNQMGYDA
ncbi:MAG: riboflavin synthase [Fibrobacteria bacterium]|nr:riboflavin synthase [Fibrobacteria bacterium]